MEGKWPYHCCFMGCCFQDLFRIACSILVQFLSSFFSIHFVGINVMHPYRRIDMTTVWKKYCVLFYQIGLTSIWLITDQQKSKLSLVAYSCHFQSMSSSFRESPFCVEIPLFRLKHFVYIHMEVNAICCLLQAIQQGFSLGRCICQKHHVICVVCVCNSAGYHLLLAFFRVKSFSFIRFINIQST